MGIENAPTPSSENPEGRVTAITGVGEDGTPMREEVENELATVFSSTPWEVFNAIESDFDNLPENNEPLKYGKREYFNIAIASDKKVLYEVVDARKGYYFLGRVYSKGEEGTPGETIHALMSYEPRNQPNPDIIVCSEKELAQWLGK